MNRRWRTERCSHSDLEGTLVEFSREDWQVFQVIHLSEPPERAEPNEQRMFLVIGYRD